MEIEVILLPLVFVLVFLGMWYLRKKWHLIEKIFPKIQKPALIQPAQDNDNFSPTFLIIDTETTGLFIDNSLRVTKKNLEEFDENFPRLVQLCMILVDKKGLYKGEVHYVKQKDKIPARATEIHGITNEICEKEGLELVEVLDLLKTYSQKVDYVVGHNISYDYKVLHAESLRNSHPFPLKDLNKVDTMKMYARYKELRLGHKTSLNNATEDLFKGQREWLEIKKQLKEHDAEGDALKTAILFMALYNRKIKII